MLPTPTANPRPATARAAPGLWLREVGDGEPLVLLHGLGMSGDTFRFIAPQLAERARLIVPDLRGHGRSAHLPGPYTAEALAADLVPMLDTLGISTAHILGHSHGGAVAQVFARAHPERVRSLVLVSSYAVQRTTWWQRMLGHVLPGLITRCGTRQMAWLTRQLRPAGGGRPLGVPAADLAADMLATNDRQCLGNALRLSRQFDSRPWLHTLQIPTLVISGGADCVVVPNQAVELARGIPGASLAILDGAGHALPLSHPAEIARSITAWLEQADAVVPAARRVPGAT